MTARGDRTAKYAGGDAHARIATGNSGSREQRTRRDADEGVRGVPHRIKPRNFIREKLHRKHKARRAHYPRITQRLQIGRQRVDAELLQQSEKKHHGVKPHATGPAQSGGGG